MHGLAGSNRHLPSIQVYGPLLNGISTFMFESTPMYPDCGRYWDMVQRHKITVFYTAPTAIRSLMRFGDDAPKKYDLSSLKVLGTVGEPINPAAWKWYYDIIGNGRCAVVDTYWQVSHFLLQSFAGVFYCLSTLHHFVQIRLKRVVISSPTSLVSLQ